jgi:hypothetical protein
MMVFSCEHCGKTFESSNPQKRFCSVKCQRRKHALDNREIYNEQARNYRKRHPTKGMSYRHKCDWDALIEELKETQQGRCYLCGDDLDLTKERGFHLDHDHDCCPYGFSCESCRRGLTCPNCNLAVGHAKDDPSRLRRIADNLEKKQKELASHPRNKGETRA